MHEVLLVSIELDKFLIFEFNIDYSLLDWDFIVNVFLIIADAFNGLVSIDFYWDV
jgi:hypothetical protein